MIVIGIGGSIYFQNLGDLNTVLLNESSRAIEFAISIAGVMAFWMGIMNIAKDSGLIDKIGDKEEVLGTITEKPLCCKFLYFALIILFLILLCQLYEFTKNGTE